MGKTPSFIGLGILLMTGTVLVLTACSDPTLPPPVASTNTPLPPAPTEAPSPTWVPIPTDTPSPVPTDTPLPRPTATPSPMPTVATALPPAAPTIASTVPATAADELTPELAEAAEAIYLQGTCAACHGANHEGGFGPAMAGLPAALIRSETRNGKPEAGSPAFSQDVISDDDLEVLAAFLAGLTSEDIGIQLPAGLSDDLVQAWDTLQAGDKAAVERHLNSALEAAADAPPGVQATLRDGLGDLEKIEWRAMIEAHLRILLGR